MEAQSVADRAIWKVLDSTGFQIEMGLAKGSVGAFSPLVSPSGCAGSLQIITRMVQLTIRLISTLSKTMPKKSVWGELKRIYVALLGARTKERK